MATNANGDTTNNLGKRRNPEEYTKKFELNEIKPLDSDGQTNIVSIANDEEVMDKEPLSNHKRANYFNSKFSTIIQP